MNRRQQMEERARQRDAERARQIAEMESAVVVPAPGGEVHPIETASRVPVAAAYRPQPFTPDLIPEPEEIDAHGPLSAQEIDELAHCESAYANAAQAEWLKWKAVHAVRSRKTYRGTDGTRTWPEYCDEVLGESESEVNRSIQQWPLAKAISEQWAQQQTKQLGSPGSHIQALLPVVEVYGLQETARDYVALRTWAMENRKRVTAGDLEIWVSKAQAIEQPDARPALTAENWLAAREERARKAEERARKAAVKPRPAPAPAAELAPAEPTERESHPNLGDEGSHPNLGDSHRESLSNEERHEPRRQSESKAAGHCNDLSAQALRIRDLINEVRDGLVSSSILQEAETDTLKSIAETARSIAEAAEAVLAGR